jgi:hypothetical protein
MKECETKKTDISEIQPHEWFLVLAMYDERLSERFSEEEWCRESVSCFDLTPNADIANLFDGYAEWILGISAEEADLRGAEQIARAGATPFEVFWWVRSRYQSNSKEIPSNDYLDGIVCRVFHKLFVEGIRDAKFDCLDTLACELCRVAVDETQYRHDKGHECWQGRVDYRRGRRQRAEKDSA